MLEVFGIKNCSTVKKSLTWLEEKKIPYEFLDVKKSVLSESLLKLWMNNMPKPYTWENLINKSGMTWRKLPDSKKNMELDKKYASIIAIKNIKKYTIINRVKNSLSSYSCALLSWLNSNFKIPILFAKASKIYV